MATQELIYDLPQIAIQDSVLRYQRDIPLLKDIVAIAVHIRNDLTDEDVEINYLNAGAQKGLQLNVYADSEKVNYFGNFLKLLQSRFYKFQPRAIPTAGDGGGDDGNWFFIVPLNIPADKFNNVRFEIDFSQCDGLDDNADNIVSGTIDVAVVYGDAVKGTFLTMETSYHLIPAAGSEVMKPPLDVELIDIYVYIDTIKDIKVAVDTGAVPPEDLHDDHLETFVFKAGTERIYDTTKGIMKIMSAVDSYEDAYLRHLTLTDDAGWLLFPKYLDRYDEIICTLNPTLITDGTMSLTLGQLAGAEEDGYWLGWLIRKTI